MNFKDNYDSGLGTSISSNANDQITLKNLSLLEELKTLLKINKSASLLNESTREKAQSSTSSMVTQCSSETNQKNTHIDSTSSSNTDNDKNNPNNSNFVMNISTIDSNFNQLTASSCSEISSASQINRHSHDIDSVLYKTIQYIKKLQKITNINERVSNSNSSTFQKDINTNLINRLFSASPLSITESSMTNSSGNSSQATNNNINQTNKSNTNSSSSGDNNSSNAKLNSNDSTMSSLSSLNSNNIDNNLNKKNEQNLNKREKSVTINNLSQILKAKINKNEDMCISIMVKTGLIFYVDDKLTNLLGHSFESWIEKRPIDFIYKHDISLFLTY